MPILWTDAESDFLVLERYNRNNEFHNIPGTSREIFWRSVARRLRRRLNFNVNARQCELRWRNLVRNYNVSK
jgi:hypothetical protein